MLRTTLALSALSVFVTVASAQPPRARPPHPQQPLPLAPGVMPGSPWGPGAPFASPIPTPPPPPGRQPQRGNAGFRAFSSYGPALPYFTTYGSGYGNGWYVPYPTYGTEVPVVEPPLPAEPTVVLANEFPAVLTLQFPSAAEVWVDGKKLPGGATEERVLTSPAVGASDKYTFNVKAQWKKEGKTYEMKRAVSLNGGDRSRMSIISGDEVKE